SDCIEYGFSIAEHDTPRGKRYEVQAKDPPRLKGEDRMIALVESLPAAGAIVVVHSGAVRDFYRSTIVRLRGAEAGKRVHVRVVRDRSSAFEGLVGGRARVFCDAGFVENARPALKSYVETLIAAIHVAIPPGM
ncbi:hypothetical protein G3V73_24145, partial [Escherichia coli]|nr:hypothetical protein [Escherichia coli]